MVRRGYRQVYANPIQLIDEGMLTIDTVFFVIVNIIERVKYVCTTEATTAEPVEVAAAAAVTTATTKKNKIKLNW